MPIKIALVNVMWKMSTVFSIHNSSIKLDANAFFQWQNDGSQYFERILNAFEHKIIIESKFWYTDRM